MAEEVPYHHNSMIEQHQPNERIDPVSISIGKKLAPLLPSRPESCICRVHDQLRNVNNRAYEPDIISIGPYHRGKKTLLLMEEHKLRYFQVILRREKENAERYVVAMRSLQEEACRCYAESLSLEENEFIEMMVLDGCFIIELLRKFTRHYLREENDFVFKATWILNSLKRDLMLFENQLPLFVLCKLFDIIEGQVHDISFIQLALRFFPGLLPGEGYREFVHGNLQHNFKHLLGLIHYNCLPSFSGTEPNGDDENKRENWRFIHCATKLREAGVKLGLIHNYLPSFARKEPNGVDMENRRENWRFIHCVTVLREAGVKFEKIDAGSLFDIKFKNGVMKVPPLKIEDWTESFFRNLIAYEQCDLDTNVNLVTDYVKFMDCLINSRKDVEILCRCGIIDNWLGDEEVVSTIFNKLTDSVILFSDQFHYAQICKEANNYCKNRAKKWMAKLRRNYLNSPWAIISVLAGFVLLFFTGTQTYFTVFPRK